MAVVDWQSKFFSSLLCYVQQSAAFQPDMLVVSRIVAVFFHLLRQFGYAKYQPKVHFSHPKFQKNLP